MSIRPAKSTPTYLRPSDARAVTVRWMIDAASSSISVVRHGQRAYAPMPPVLRPWSPSSARLWSCAPGMQTAVVPSQKASTEHSGPYKHSSTTHWSPADPKTLSTITFFSASTVSSLVVGMSTPLPPARPLHLTTTG